MARETTLDELAGLMTSKSKNSNKCDYHRWGVVKSKNSDGTYEVKLNQSGIDTSSSVSENFTATCAALCSCAVNDRVLVLVISTGQTVILGKKT